MKSCKRVGEKGTRQKASPRGVFQIRIQNEIDFTYKALLLSQAVHVINHLNAKTIQTPLKAIDLFVKKQLRRALPTKNLKNNTIELVP